MFGQLFPPASFRPYSQKICYPTRTDYQIRYQYILIKSPHPLSSTSLGKSCENQKPFSASTSFNASSINFLCSSAGITLPRTLRPNSLIIPTACSSSLAFLSCLYFSSSSLALSYSCAILFPTVCSNSTVPASRVFLKSFTSPHATF